MPILQEERTFSTPGQDEIHNFHPKPKGDITQAFHQ
jgi:hypothetical protein